MPAKNLSRIDKEGIYSHIYNRGVEKRIIFNDEEDYKVFLGYLKDYLIPKDPDSIKKVFKVHGHIFRGTPHQPKNYFNKVELIAYSLMPDHFHLLLHQVTKGSLEKFVRSLCTRYSMYFNKKYHRTGALFEGPYKSVQIKDELHLSHLTRYLHHNAGDYTSYPEYLGSRQTLWVKTEVVLSSFYKETGRYKNFVEKKVADQEGKELIDGLTVDSKSDHLERSLEGRNLARNEEMRTDPDLKVRSRMPEFLATSTLMFLLLVALGVRNVHVSTAKNYQPLPTTVSDVLSETKIVKPEATPEASPKTTVTVEINDASSSVNIRQKPTTDSAKIGQAKDGDTFEFISFDSRWYEIKLIDGTVGFISERYVVMEARRNN